jgi:hypothetical protein
MKRFLILFSTSLLALTFVSSAHSQTSWEFKTDSVNLNLKGVSPYAEKLSTGDDRLYFPSPNALPDNIMVTDCNTSGFCTRKSLSSKFGVDPTIVTLKDGSRKIFFVETTSSTRSIKFATLGPDGLSHGVVSDLGVADSSVSDKRGWGVPDSVVLPDGRVRIYWVNMDLSSTTNTGEFIISATSTDETATKFVRDSGIRLNGYVDPKILRSTTGDWVMICATGPGSGVQKLYMATSNDGLSWSITTNSITDNSQSAFDPTGYSTGDNSWRIYYVSAAPGNGLGNDNLLKRASLSRTVTAGGTQGSGGSNSGTSSTKSGSSNNSGGGQSGGSGGILAISDLSKKWLLKQDNLSLGLTGVSPHVVNKLDGKNRLFYTTPKASPDSIMITDCTDSGECSRKTLGSKFGMDVTTVTLKDGTKRVFYVENVGQSRTIKFATLSQDGLSFSSPQDLGVEGSSVSDKRGWGVPDSVVMPDGRVKVFWVTMDFPPTHNPPEDVVSATSTDATATKFVLDNGYRLRGGYASTKILQAKAGDWIMILCTANTHAQLYIATSQNGSQWTLDKNPISGTDESAFDPTGYKLSDNTWRIYYASSPVGEEIGPNTVIKRATLTYVGGTTESSTPAPSTSGSKTSEPSASTTHTATPTSSAKPSATSITITCVKGKITKKVSGVNPKCSTGYTKK